MGTGPLRQDSSFPATIHSCKCFEKDCNHYCMLLCPKVRISRLIDKQPHSLKEKVRALLNSRWMRKARYWFSAIGSLYFWLIDAYAKLSSPLTELLFVGWIEWTMWTKNTQGETFRHVGQWGALVAAVVVFIGAMVGYTFSASTASSQPHGAQQAIPLSTLSITSQSTHTSL